MVRYLELLAEIGDYLVVEIGTIVYDDPFGDDIPTFEVMFNEPGHNILGNGGKRDCFNPFCEVINSD